MRGERETQGMDNSALFWSRIKNKHFNDDNINFIENILKHLALTGKKAMFNP